MTIAQYKAYFKEYGDKGFKLAYLNGYTEGGKPMLSGVWYKTTSYGSYIAKHYQTSTE